MMVGRRMEGWKDEGWKMGRLKRRLKRQAADDADADLVVYETQSRAPSRDQPGFPPMMTNGGACDCY
jgi:hypothetical protein